MSEELGVCSCLERYKYVENKRYLGEGPQGCQLLGKKNSYLIGKNQSQAMKKEMCCSCNLVTASGIAGSRCSKDVNSSPSRLRSTSSVSTLFSGTACPHGSTFCSLLAWEPQSKDSLSLYYSFTESL